MQKVQKYEIRLAKAGVLKVAETKADCFEAARSILHALLKDKPHEEVYLIAVNGRSEVTGVVMVSRGGMHGCALTARDVLLPAVAQNAAAFILGHNHPSGDPKPSVDDIEMTRHIKKCAELLGIPLLDHIVVCSNGQAASIIELL